MTQETLSQENVSPISIGSSVDTDVACFSCKKTGKSSDFFCYEGKDNTDQYLCHECRTLIQGELEANTRNVNYVGALLLGFVASFVGGILWYFITLALKREFLYLSIGLGYIIGLGVLI